MIHFEWNLDCGSPCGCQSSLYSTSDTLGGSLVLSETHPLDFTPFRFKCHCLIITPHVAESLLRKEEGIVSVWSHSAGICFEREFHGGCLCHCSPRLKWTCWWGIHLYYLIIHAKVAFQILCKLIFLLLKYFSLSCILPLSSLAFFNPCWFVVWNRSVQMEFLLMETNWINNVHSLIMLMMGISRCQSVLSGKRTDKGMYHCGLNTSQGMLHENSQSLTGQCRICGWNVDFPLLEISIPSDIQHDGILNSH